MNSSKILEKLCVQKKKFILFSTHREENTNSKKKLKNIVNTVSYLAKKFKYKIVFPCHPRIYKKINKLLPKNKKIIFLKPMGFFDYNKLIKSSFIFMSDSGTVNEEANILKINAINLRSSHERHEANDEASSIMTRINIKNISNAINIFEKNKDQKINTIKDYKVDNVSDKITKIILSNIDYININVWKKHKLKKILIISQYFWPENFRINDIFFKLLKDKNYDVTVITTYPSYQKKYKWKDQKKNYKSVFFFKRFFKIFNYIELFKFFTFINTLCAISI